MGAATQIIIGFTPVEVEVASCRFSDGIDIFIATITRSSEYHEITTFGFHHANGFTHRLNRGRVMTIIQHDFEVVLIKHIHATRRLEERRIEGA